MFNASYKVATVWGIPIRLHVSLLLMVVFFIYHFGGAFGFMWGIIFGVTLEIGLGVSIVLHELGHSLVALRKGCRVREITLLCIGGAAQMENMPSRPRDEFIMAAAGPAVSLVLGVVLIYGGGALAMIGLGDLPVLMLQLLGIVNIWLVLFNLLPSFPMDGGRILRAALTPKLGRLRATAVAARLGRIMAVVFGLFGILNHNWVLVAVAFFVYSAASNEYRMVELQEQFKRVHGWPFPFGSEAAADDDGGEDAVVVGPPPYERGDGGDTKVKIFPRLQG